MQIYNKSGCYFHLRKSVIIKIVSSIYFFISIFIFPQDTTDSMLLLREASELCSAEDYETALSKVDLAISKDDTNYYAYYTKGVILYYLADYKKAKEVLLIAVELNPGFKENYEMLRIVSVTLGQTAEAEKYLELYNNPPVNNVHIDDYVIEEYHNKGLNDFNEYQSIIGNKPAKLDSRLNQAAKAHAEYISFHYFNQPISLQWHYEEPGKEGFTGKDPTEQAQTFGFFASSGYFVGNTVMGWLESEYISPKIMFEHIMATIYHRPIILAPNFEAIGMHLLEQEGQCILVFFYSFLYIPEKPVVIFYPMANHTGVPTDMMPELPEPFPGDNSVGFPITVQIYSNDNNDVPVLEKSWLKNKDGSEIPIYTITPNTDGQAGDLMKAFKMICIASKNPLKPNTQYQVYIRVKNKNNNTLFDKKWFFKTE